MYRQEHPEHFEQVKKETAEHIRREMELLSAPSPDDSERPE